MQFPISLNISRGCTSNKIKMLELRNFTVFTLSPLVNISAFHQFLFIEETYKNDLNDAEHLNAILKSR